MPTHEELKSNIEEHERMYALSFLRHLRLLHVQDRYYNCTSPAVCNTQVLCSRKLVDAVDYILKALGS